MIKLPRRPSTTWTHGRRLQSPAIRYQMGSGVSARFAWHPATRLETNLKKPQSKLRANPGLVESICAGTALVRPTSETILASVCYGPRLGRGPEYSRFTVGVENNFSVQFVIRQGCRRGSAMELYSNPGKYVQRRGNFVRTREMGVGSG